jgi:uncharacterized protein YecT (DUF1311 family)
MKNLVFLSALLLFMTAPVFSQSQSEINKSACDLYMSADTLLNETYKKILIEYKEDTAFIKNLKTAQNIWIKLRDADIKAIFTPDEFWGSVEPMCACGILEEFTKDRINFLKTWVDGIDHQDACNGTRKEK